MAGNVYIREGNSGMYLLAVYLGRSHVASPLLFVSRLSESLSFETVEEANATITFIGDVIDYETSQCLEIIVEPEVTSNV